jgi:transposase-like protein
MTDAPLSSAQLRAIQELLRSSSVAEAARAVGVAPSTLWRWRSDPAFAGALQEAQRQRYEAALELLASATERAVATMVGLLEEEDPSVRLRAALGVLEYGTKIIKTVDLPGRVSALEREARIARNGRTA